MNVINKHECDCIRNKEFVGVEKFIHNKVSKWFLRIDNTLNKIKHCPYCGIELETDKLVQQMQLVKCSHRLPENEVNKAGIVKPLIVLCTDGKTWYKAYYVKYREFDCETQGYFEGDSDIDKKTGEEYWPEGWYECSSENEEIDWSLGAKITYWMPLPPMPKGAE